MKKPSQQIEELGTIIHLDGDRAGTKEVNLVMGIIRYLDEQHERTVGNFNANKQTNE